VAATVVALGLLGAGFAGGWLTHRPPPLVTVPDLRGESVYQASLDLRDQGLRLRLNSNKPVLPEWHVASQVPDPGGLVPPGTIVLLGAAP
jgi:beta-lactam-binding protein with PASTA domain